jgi:predicted ATPase/DNA-binding SARP family transcriptional activator
VVRIAILGPLLVTDDVGNVVPIAGARLRALLIRLALDAGRTVGIDALTEAVWDGAPPAQASNALQTLVSRLRRGVPAGAIAAEPAGYSVAATVDVDAFDALVRKARAAATAGNLAAALADYEAALSLWRGAPLVDVADAGFARATIARLNEAHVAATEERLAVRLVRHGGDVVVADLEELAAANPLRERPHRLLVVALAHAGRAGDAVAAYTRLRERFADELGLDPSSDLAAAYAQMLRGEPIPVLPGWPAAGDGVRDEPPVRGNLRPALTSFVGRDDDMDRVVEMVRANRLVTLVGAGGSGKTRLATEAGRALRGGFPGGAWLVELASVSSPDDVPRVLAETLRPSAGAFAEPGVLADHTSGVLRRALDLLGSRGILLILDNCEHLLDACARLVEDVLVHCPSVRIVATSREPLGVTAEALSAVGPLGTAPVTSSLDDIARAAAVRLFVDRAAAVRAGFDAQMGTDETTMAAVAEICRRLDGMPLAIELACARLRTMPVQQIASRLDDRFRLLTGGSRTALPRHQTLAAVVDWSWDLLHDGERDLAKRLSVFAGGAAMDTILEVCGRDSLDRLAGLVDKSFVVLGDDGRYRMLETIRAYTADRLAKSGAADDTRRAHADHFMRLAEASDVQLRNHGQAAALRIFRTERDNFAAALRWAIDAGEAMVAVRLASGLGWYWMMSDYHSEAAGWFDQVLAVPGDVPPRARARALALYGMNIAVVAPDEDSQAAVDEAAAVAPDDPIVVLSQVLAGVLPIGRDAALKILPTALEHPDPWVRAMGMTMRGVLQMYAGEPGGAERDLTEGLAGFEAVGDDWARAMLGGALGELRALRGDTDGAVAALRRSVSIAESIGVEDVAAQSILQLSLVRARRGEYDEAQADVERAKATAARLGSHVLRFGVGVAEAEIARRRGDLRAARNRYRETLDATVDVRAIPRESYAGLLGGLMLTEHLLGDRQAARRTAANLLAHTAREHIVVVITTLAFAGVLRDVDPARAVYLIGMADAMRGTAEPGNPDVDSIVVGARARLGDDAYDEAHARGLAVDSVDTALDALRAAAAALDAASEIVAGGAV